MSHPVLWRRRRAKSHIWARYQPEVTQFEFDPKDGRTNGGRLHNTRLAQLLWDMG